jgi:hypothetical protein
MHRISLLGLALAFFLINALGCGDSEPKKVEENPFKARQEMQNGQGTLMMPKGVMAPKNDNE